MAEKKGMFSGLFGKKEAEAPAAENAPLLILGGGCQSCHALEDNTRSALGILGKSIPIGHVTDFSQIAQYGVMQTPALVFHGKVLSSGKVLRPEEIADLLRKAEE